MTPPTARPVRVGVIADTIEGPGGMGRYARGLVAGLARRDDVELVVAAPAGARERLASLHAVRSPRMVPVPGRGQILDAAWEVARLGSLFERHGVDLVHGTKHLLPRTRLPTVLTAFDLTAFSWPGQAGWAKRVLLPSQYRSALRRSHALLAISEATRVRLADFDPSWAAKAEALPLGISVDLLDVPPTPVPELDGRVFALVVGDLSPRKNIGILAGIWDDVYERTGAVLALAGAGGKQSPELLRRLDELETRGRVRRLGSIPPSGLRWCYENCRVVLFPSFEEGFGFPVVEARLFGAPVVASTDPALVEVADGRAVHVDARDPSAWSEAVVDAVTRGEADAAAGSVPASGVEAWPTWDDHAAGAVDLYRRVLGRP